MNIKGLVITKHAKERFLERLDLESKPGNPFGFLEKLLIQAKAEIGGNVFKRIEREMKHKDDTEYYRTKCGWRFIVVLLDDGKRKLVTVERTKNYKSKNMWNREEEVIENDSEETDKEGCEKDEESINEQGVSELPTIDQVEGVRGERKCREDSHNRLADQSR